MWILLKHSSLSTRYFSVLYPTVRNNHFGHDGQSFRLSKLYHFPTMHTSTLHHVNPHRTANHARLPSQNFLSIRSLVAPACTVYRFASYLPAIFVSTPGEWLPLIHRCDSCRPYDTPAYTLAAYMHPVNDLRSFTAVYISHSIATHMHIITTCMYIHAYHCSNTHRE